MGKIFLPSRSPPKIACDFRGGQEHIWLGEKNGFSSDFWPLFPKEKGRIFSSSDISPDSGSPQIPKESEETAVLSIPGPLRFPWNLRGRPFLRFLRNRKERQDVFPSAPQGQRKKTRVFLRAIHGSEETLLCRRKSLAIFDGRGRKEKSSIFLFPERKIFDLSFLESERKARFYSLCPAGAEEKKTRVRGKPVLFLIFPPTPSESGEIRPFFPTPSESEKKDQEKGPSSAVENRLRFSTADEGPPKIHGIFGGQRNRKKFALFPCVFLSDRRWLCRKWHAIFGKAISARLSTCFFPLPLRGRGKKSSPKARPRESIRSPENCIQFSGDKSEIRAAGGLRKGEKRSVKKSQKGARNRRKQRFLPGIDL